MIVVQSPFFLHNIIFMTLTVLILLYLIDVEVVYSEKATITELAVVTEQTRDTEEDKDEEDLDIDAI